MVPRPRQRRSPPLWDKRQRARSNKINGGVSDVWRGRGWHQAGSSGHGHPSTDRVTREGEGEAGQRDAGGGSSRSPATISMIAWSYYSSTKPSPLESNKTVPGAMEVKLPPPCASRSPASNGMRSPHAHRCSNAPGGRPRIPGSTALVCFVLFAPGLQDLLRIGEQLDATEQKNGALPGGEPPLSSSTHIPRPAVPPSISPPSR